MLAAVAAAAFLSSCVPMRWISADPASLRLLDGSPVSCLLLERGQTTGPMVDAIKKRRLKSIAVVHSGEAASRVKEPVDAIALEGAYSGGAKVIHIAPRRELIIQRDAAVIATSQGVWPGIRIEHPGPRGSSAPTGSIWINTNTGVLRWLRASTDGAIWLASKPPEDEHVTASRYGHAIADAASVGAHWVVALDSKLAGGMLKGESAALTDWKVIQGYLRFYEEHAEWRSWPAHAELAMVQDPSSAALVSGNLLDMLSVMNTPVRAVSTRELTGARLEGTKLTVTIQPQDYTAEQQALIRKFTDGGGKVVRGPEGFRMPSTGDRITFDKDEYRTLEAIWPELHLAVMRKNFGVRMFNVSGALSYLQSSPDGKRKLLQLVNYTDYPVESITAFVQGKFRRARFYSPDGGVRELTVYDAPEGTGVEIDKLGLCGAVVLE